MKSYILLCAVLCLGVAIADLDNVTDITDAEVYCKYQAYLQTLDLAEKIKNGTMEIINLTDVVTNYVACKYNAKEEDTLENRFADSDTAVVQNKTSDIIKCVLTNVLDMAKCIVNDELTGDMKWKWVVVSKCSYSFLPRLLFCSL
ncbi:uncharacterized protein LOC111351019 isoform X2 [Spodoptera litura]|uniref:Uncharacterized protein LOC111351019 isoform X2 n=1 Tax=Spodoptera litura TaxID=69820 RepID=A0A9J7DU89_SPOLT|nr:uncharacterized protein LOC111351019 isoform X2 [Spodoptera litura]